MHPRLAFIIFPVLLFGGIGSACSDSDTQAANGDPEGEKRYIVYEPPSPDIESRSWHRSGDGLGCIVRKADSVYQNLADDLPEELICQHIGPLQVGGQFPRVSKALGTPFRKPVDTDSQKVYAYVMEPADDPKKKGHPYIVVGAIRDTITLLQLTGPPPSEKYSLDFSSLELGDSVTVVEEVLGEPWKRSSVSDTAGVEQWTYGPYPISLEVKEGKVFSIRIWWKGKGPRVQKK